MTSMRHGIGRIAARFRRPEMIILVAVAALVVGIVFAVMGSERPSAVAFGFAAIFSLALGLLILSAIRRLSLQLNKHESANAQILAEFRSLTMDSDKVDEISRRLSSHPGGLRAQLRSDIVRDTAALFQLHGAIGLAHEHVPLTTYSALPSTVLLLAACARNLDKDDVIVELGSGTSTLWMAAALRRDQREARIVSVDHDAEWANYTWRALEQNGLSRFVDLRVSPLSERSDLPDKPTWYSPEAFHGLANITMLFVDGPPRRTGPMARRPAIAQLAPLMARSCTVVLDDTNRPDERDQVAMWLAALGPRSRIDRQIERTTVIVRE